MQILETGIALRFGFRISDVTTTEREMSEKERFLSWANNKMHDFESIFMDAMKEAKRNTNPNQKRNKMPKTKVIEIYVYPAKGEPYKTQIDNSLEAMQKVVGGYIEPVRHPATEVLSFAFGGKPVVLIANEEGNIHNLPPNENIFGLVGDCFFMLDADFE